MQRRLFFRFAAASLVALSAATLPAWAKDGSDDSGSDDHDSGGHGSDDSGSDDNGSGGHGSDDTGSDDHGSGGHGADDSGSDDHGGDHDSNDDSPGDDHGGHGGNDDGNHHGGSGRDDALAELNLRVRYADGFEEHLKDGLYWLVDDQGRLVVRRPATQADATRMLPLDR